MAFSANVLSVKALEDLRSNLIRFAGEAQESLDAAQLEIRRTFDWLQQRHNHWQGEVHRRQESLVMARAVLAACQQPVRDSEGHVYIPPCTREKEAVVQAQRYLAEAEAELRNVQDWMRLVQQATDDYNRQAQRFATVLSAELPKGSGLLAREIDSLRAYLATSGAAIGYTVPTPKPVLDQKPAVGVAGDYQADNHPPDTHPELEENPDREMGPESGPSRIEL